MTTEEFRELSEVPVTTLVSLSIRVTAQDLWIGLSAPGEGKRRQIFSRRYDRPEGKTEGDCVRAGLQGAINLLAGKDEVL